MKLVDFKLRQHAKKGTGQCMTWLSVSAIMVAVEILDVSIGHECDVHEYKRNSKLLAELELEDDDQKDGYEENEKQDEAKLGVWN